MRVFALERQGWYQLGSLTRMQNALTIGELIGRIYETGFVQGEDDALHKVLPAAVTPDRGAYLAEVCRQVLPAATVEVGMAWGLSTFWILQALLGQPQRQRVPHVVMDPFQLFGYHRAALRALREIGLESMVEFYEEPSINVLEGLAAKERSFDFAFIDGDHSYEAVMCDLWLLDPLLQPGGVIVFDDVWSEGVQRACLLAEQELGYTMRSEHPDRNSGRQTTMRTYVKSDRQVLLRPSDRTTLARQFSEARAKALKATYTNLRKAERRYLARYHSRAGLKALGRGEQAAARLSFYYSLRNRPFKLKNYGRLARTFLPPALARALSGGTVKNTRNSRDS